MWEKILKLMKNGLKKPSSKWERLSKKIYDPF
jgi:hypothetical protein